MIFKGSWINQHWYLQRVLLHSFGYFYSRNYFDCNRINQVDASTKVQAFWGTFFLNFSNHILVYHTTTKQCLILKLITF